MKPPRIGHIRTNAQTTTLPKLLDGGSARILSATISEEAGRWFVSFTCAVEREDAPVRFPDVVGIDLGVSKLAVLSTGEVVANPRPLSR